MTTQASSFIDPATIALAYKRVSLTVARGPRGVETLPPAPVGPRTALVVEANVEVAARIVRSLRADGLEVTHALPGDDLHARVFAARSDVILVRVGRNDPQSVTTCRQLAESDGLRLRTIIAYETGDGDEDSVERALQAGADDFIADVRRERELRARVATQLRHVRDREVMHWARAQRSSLRELANTDPLTGVANRRGVGQALDQALVSGEAVTLVLVDLDHFKRINDTHGHPAGDLVLRRVARALDAVTPLGGTAGRWGGEEFAMVLSGDAAGSAQEIGERVRRAVSEIVFSEIDGTPRVTASVGVAAWTGRGDSPANMSLVAAADAALYQSKHAGRNCVHASLVRAG